MPIAKCMLAAGIAAFVLACPGRPACAAPPNAVDAPQGHDVSWRLAGPGGGGWIQSIAYDPQDAGTLYVGCDVGGFYFSSDNGRSYEIRNNGLRDDFVESIAVHPRDSSIILLGTEGGIFRTADRGMSWQWMRDGFPPIERYSFSAPIGAVCFDPQDPNVAYAGVGRPRQSREGRGAIYRSDDTGRTWRNVSEGQLPSDAVVSDIDLKPGDSRVVLAATNRGVFRSEDAGKTWQPSNEGLPHPCVEELAFAPSSPGVVYVSIRTTARNDEQWNGGVYRSEDGGHTWRPANGAGMPRTVGRSNQPGPMTSGIKEIAVDPRNADVVYAGSTAWVTDGVYRTTDAGGTWARVATRGSGIVDYGWITQWGTTVTCIALSPADPDRVAVGTSGHLFATEDAGRTWQQRYCKQFPDGRFTGTGLEVTCLNGVIPDPVRPHRLYFCYMDIGLLISEDDGRTFRRSSEGMEHGDNCTAVAVDPEEPSTIWAGTGEWGSNVGLICRSDDDGVTWRVVGRPESGLPNGQNRRIILDPRSPAGRRRLIATSRGNGLYESKDGGESWRCINGNVPPGVAGDPPGLLMDPADPLHLVAAFGGMPQAGGGIYETRDAGATWSRTAEETPFADVTGLTADPAEFRTLYVAARFYYDHASQHSYPGGAFKSRDGGKTWQQILDYYFVSSVAVSPADPNVIYAATHDHPYHDDCAAEGLLKSADGGLTWQHENAGLAALDLSCLSVSPHDPSVIYVGTGGNSAFVGKDSAVAAAGRR